jgi:hypothetical protein
MFPEIKNIDDPKVLANMKQMTCEIISQEFQATDLPCWLRPDVHNELHTMYEDNPFNSASGFRC